MKKLLFIILILLSTSHCFSQQLEIISVEAKPMDLYGRVNEKLDLNGNKCAVIKVQVDDDIIEISGMIGNVISQGIEKSIYVTQETKKIKIKFAKHLPITIDPKEYGIDKLIGGCTYEIYLKSEEEKQMYTVEKSTGIIPEWINDVKEGQFVGISMPNNNAAAAKKQALAMATLQYIIYNGGAKVKDIIKSNLFINENRRSINEDYHSEEKSRGIIHYNSYARYSDFAVNIAREYYNINGEYFVLCEFIRDNHSKNYIEITKKSHIERTAIDGDTTAIELNKGYWLNSDIQFYINGLTCNISSTNNYSGSGIDNTTRIDGEIVFNNGYNYPNFNIVTGLKERILNERIDLLSYSIGYSQMCFVTSTPLISSKYHTRLLFNSWVALSKQEDQSFSNDTIYIYNIINNKDSLSVPVKVKWGGVHNNKPYYSIFDNNGEIEQNIASNICQYSLDSDKHTLIMSKYFSFIEAMENLCICLFDNTGTHKDNIENDIDFKEEYGMKIPSNATYNNRIEEYDICIKNIHLFPIITSRDKKFNSKFNGVIVCSNEKLPFDINTIFRENLQKNKEKKKIHHNITNTFSPFCNISGDFSSVDIFSGLAPTGFAHQILLLKNRKHFFKKTIELYGIEAMENDGKNYIVSSFWDNRWDNLMIINSKH